MDGNKRKRTGVALGGIALATALATGCSAGSGSSSSQAGTGSTEELRALYDGTYSSPPTAAPKPEPGKNVWIVSFGQALDDAAKFAEGAEDAAESIGWKTTVFDGQFQPNVQLSGIQQAVAAKADGIILYAIDCSLVKTGLESAKKAGIAVVGLQSQDCNPSLETPMAYGEYGDFKDYFRAMGAAGAQWLAATVGPDGKVIELKATDSEVTLAESEGFTKALKSECPDCEHIVVETTGADFGPGIQQKTQQALLQNPDAKGLWAPYDALVTSGVASAVMSSAQANTLRLVSAGGSEANLDLIREGRGQHADVSGTSRWDGFAAIDWMNRLFHGETPTAETAPTGNGFRLVDAEHGLPDSGLAPSGVDFEGIYRKAWGVDK